MPRVNVEIEVWCSCGAGLCNQSQEHHSGRGIMVEPCDKCLQKEYGRGYDDGYDKGFDGGYQEKSKEE